MKKGIKILIVAFIIVGILVCSYFLILKPYITNIAREAYKYGAQYGYNYVINITDINLGSCHTMLYPYGNLTINITAVDCIGRWH